MVHDGLTETLRVLVRRHGMSSILRHLANVQSTIDQSASALSSPRARNASKGKLSAEDYVYRMALPSEKAELMKRAAEHFERKSFLPTIADIREFWRVHGVEPTKTTSRAGAVPRVFTFLATMDSAKIAKILDDGAFSGPAQLAPIADAIRSYRTTPRHTQRDEYVVQAADPTTRDAREQTIQARPDELVESAHDKKHEDAI